MSNKFENNLTEEQKNEIYEKVLSELNAQIEEYENTMENIFTTSNYILWLTRTIKMSENNYNIENLDILYLGVEYYAKINNLEPEIQIIDNFALQTTYTLKYNDTTFDLIKLSSGGTEMYTCEISNKDTYIDFCDIDYSKITEFRIKEFQELNKIMLSKRK